MYNPSLHYNCYTNQKQGLSHLIFWYSGLHIQAPAPVKSNVPNILYYTANGIFNIAEVGFDIGPLFGNRGIVFV